MNANNNMRGEIAIDLDTSDPSCEGETPKTLYAFIEGDDQGVRDDPQLTLMTRDPSKRDGCEQVWFVSIALLRKVLAAAESMHAVGSIGWASNEREER